MPFTFEGIDNQFAVSTGNNVGSTANSSTFDNPPQGSKDLFVTTKEGDDDPRLFEIGDTYDVQWAGQGGGTMTDAVVVRSDPSPDGAGTGVIVFEGIDENGDPAQVIWTPGFDLEQWYNDNYNPSMEPQFYTEDTDASYDHKFVCFASEARIKTPHGPIPVSALLPGDLVTTKDCGNVAVKWVGTRSCPAKGESAPVVFERGALGNSGPLRLSQQHRVLIKSPIVQYYFGYDEVFVPAKACVNGHNIRIVAGPHIEYCHILLEHHHVIWAEGMECESLFAGDQAMTDLYDTSAFQCINFRAISATQRSHTARPVLKMKEAVLLMQMMHGSYNAPHGHGVPLDVAVSQQYM